MYKEDPVFEKPDSENIKVWRYLDFTKFVSLLDRQSLFFVRADKFDDPFEGSISKGTIESTRKAMYGHLYDRHPELRQISVGDVRVKTEYYHRKFRKFTIINCWHMNEHESAAMWKLNLKSDEGIAVQSTFKKLAESFNHYEDNDVYIGKVKYIDYEKDPIPETNYWYPFVFKRKSFEHERELRAIIFKNFSLDIGERALKMWDMKKGEYIPADMNKLIDRIFVSPTSEEWFKDLVESITNRFCLKKKVKHSSLTDAPMF